MKGFFNILLFILVAIVSWGVYGPMLATGRAEMHGAWLPFMYLGLAYFVIAVVVPPILLQVFGEKGHWSATGIIWSMGAGLCGAIGAMGVILAALNGGARSMLYVMPLVFGVAPVVNTFVTIYLSKTFKQVGPVFYAGLILVIAGSATVLLTAPRAPATSATPAASAAQPASANQSGPTAAQLALVFLCTAVTAIAFGCYGPALHKGQMAMAGSRLRPFLCVGIAYFIVAVVVPAIILRTGGETSSQYNFAGAAWSFAGGAAGAIGALGVIMAFNLGGKPVYVMPLVFGGAPVVNTFVEVGRHSAWGHIQPFFYAGLIVTIAGAVTVLIFAPRGHAAAHGAPTEPSGKIQSKTV